MRIALLLIVLLGATLRLDGLATLALLGDELEDLQLLERTPPGSEWFLEGEEAAWDQARLPFTITAVACRVIPLPPFQVARYVSVGFACAVLLAVYLLGKALGGVRAGLLAAFLQSVSIYDLGFSRLGLTSSSSLFVGLFLLGLFCFWRAITTGQFVWHMATGIAIGISMAAKGFGMFGWIIVACWLLAGRPSSSKADWSVWPMTRPARRWLQWNLLHVGVFMTLAVGRWHPMVELGAFTLAACTLVLGHWKLVQRHRAEALAEAVGPTLLLLFSNGLLYFFVFSSAHLDWHRLVSGLGWMTRWHQALHVQTTVWDFVPVLLVRLDLPWNALWLLALIWLLRRRTRADRFLLLAFAVPFMVLSLSRWKVTWYLMMVFPICYLMIARLLDEAWIRCRQSVLLLGAFGLSLGVGVAWYASQLSSLRPYYEIDGYRLGPTMIGWHRPSFITFERVPDAVQWLETHLPRPTEIACLLIDHPVYGAYAYDHVLWYQQDPQVRYRFATSVEDALSSPFVVTSLYSEQTHQMLEAHGYQVLHQIWLKDLIYATIFTSIPS